MQHYLLLTPRVSLCFFKVTPSFEGNVYKYVYAVEVLSYWTVYVFKATLAGPHINAFLQFLIYTQKWRIIPGNNTFYTLKDVFPSFSQLCFTNLARLCHKKSWPQIRESLYSIKKANSAWRGGKGWVEMLQTCTSYILDTELHNTMFFSYQSSHANALHITFWMKYNFTTCTCQFE
jgi:hypothetical protein